MTATDELRRLLDERGVEHADAEDGHTQHTWWSDGDHEIAASNSGERLAVYNLTPAQAVAATLGHGECHDTWDTELTGRLWFQCSECGAVSLEIAPRFCPACGREVVSA